MAPRQTTTANPFPGLRPFEQDEAHLFFGRDGQSDELIRKLRRTRFLAIVGTSGSGKSSLVRAGLLPSLGGGLMTEAGSSWRVALFRPGDNPIGSLAGALNAPGVFGGVKEDEEVRAAILEATLRRSAQGLVEAARQARMEPAENLLVIVDQFEELFRFARVAKRSEVKEDAAAFVKLLLEASKQREIDVYVVITMRSDFLGDCAQFRDLPEALNDGQYLIPRMTRDQWRQAMTGPAAVGGAKLSTRLIQKLLNDVGDDPDQLPVLQHALMRTWQYWSRSQRNGRAIGIEDYEAVGEMGQALSRHADEAFDALPDDRSKYIAEKMFKCLTEKSSDNREVRRPTTVRLIATVAEAEVREVIRVIEHLRRGERSFLIPPAPTGLQEDSVVDISHESLIRQWKRLKTWVEEETQSRAVFLRIVDAAQRWREGRAALWRNPELEIALKWMREEKPNEAWGNLYGASLNQAVEFLKQSERELTKFKKRLLASGLLIAIVSLSVLLVMASYMGFEEIRQVSGASFAAIATETARKLDLVVSEEVSRTRQITRDPRIIKPLERRRDQNLSEEDRMALEAAMAKAWDQQEPRLVKAITGGELGILLRRYYTGPTTEPEPQVPVVTRSAKRALFITDIHGTLVASINADASFANGQKDWFQGTFNQGVGQAYMSNVTFDERFKVFTFSLSLPIMDSIRYQAVGVLHQVYDAKEFLAPSVHPIRFGKTGHVMVIDTAGTVITCPILPTGTRLADPRLVELVTPAQPGWGAASSSGHGDGSASIIASVAGTIIGFARLPQTSRVTESSTGRSWNTFVWQAPEELFAPVQHLLIWLTVFAAVAIVLAMTLVSLGVRRIVRAVSVAQDLS